MIEYWLSKDIIQKNFLLMKKNVFILIMMKNWKLEISLNLTDMSWNSKLK